MTPLKSAEEVAKELLNVYHRAGGWKAVGDGFVEVIKLDRSRLVAYIKSKMPRKDTSPTFTSIDFSVREGFNKAIEAVEKILEEVK